MDDVLIVVSQFLLSRPTDPSSLVAFVKLQATHRAVWLRYKQKQIIQRLRLLLLQAVVAQ